MALLSEVWDDMVPTSPPAPKKEEPIPIVTPIAKPVIQETYQNAPIISSTPKPNSHKGLPLFLALLVTGGCAIYAIDTFTGLVSSRR